jgi:tripartite-type tricarboxylate transporter receptor subunit TctC
MMPPSFGGEMNNRRKLLIALGASVLARPFSAVAQAYPNRPIKLIVPFPPGGGTDIIARLVADRLAQRLAQPILIDNKPGAGATIGADATAKAAPDGYTLLMGVVRAYAIAQTYNKSLGYDIRRDLAPVSMVGHGSVVLVVTPGLAAHSVKELVALAKANPGKYEYASSGAGGEIHLANELFKHVAGIDIVHIPYKGTAQFLPDLISGRIAMSLDSMPAYIPYIKSGKLRALAVGGHQRSPVFPDLPTLEESGFPVEAGPVYALLAPAGTPREFIARLNRELGLVLQERDLRDQLAKQGYDIGGSTPEAVQAFVEEEIAKWAKVMADAKIKPE